MDKMNSLEFQRQFLSTCLIDNDYVKTILTNVKSEYFNDVLAVIWDEIYNNISEYGFVTYDALHVIFDKQDDPHTLELLSLKREIGKLNETPNTIRWVKDHVKEFIQTQEAKNALMQCMTLLKSGEFNGMIPLWQNVINIGLDNHQGLNYEEIGTRLDQDDREAIPTGIDELDKILSGGLGRGELGTVVAPSGAGKTWFLSMFGAAAFKRGLTAVHFSFELLENYVGNRYDMILTERSIKDLRKDPGHLKSVIDNGGLLRIREYPMMSASVHTLRSYIEQLHLNNIVPDVILVDYADLMVDVKGGDGRHALSNIYMGLKGLAQELRVPIWTASQTNRSGVDTFIIDETVISEEYRKIAHSDVVLGASRAKYDRAYDGSRLFIIKQRNGEDKVLIPGTLDTSRGAARFYGAESIEGRELLAKMQRAKIDYERDGTLSQFDTDTNTDNMEALLANLRGKRK